MQVLIATLPGALMTPVLYPNCSIPRTAAKMAYDRKNVNPCNKQHHINLELRVWSCWKAICNLHIGAIEIAIIRSF